MTKRTTIPAEIPTGLGDDHPTGPTPHPRPSWLTEPCPAWCEGGHLEREHPDDRTHYGPIHNVPLLLEAPSEVDEGTWAPETAQFYLRQHWLHRDAYVWLGHGESGMGLRLRLEEAEALAERLLVLVGVALQ